MHWLFSSLFVLSVLALGLQRLNLAHMFAPRPFTVQLLWGSNLDFPSCGDCTKQIWPHANLNLYPLTSRTQQFDLGFFLSTWPPALHLTCIYILSSLISMVQDPASDLPAVVLSLFLKPMSSKTTFRIAALPALPLPTLLLPQKSHWFTAPICPALVAS